MSAAASRSGDQGFIRRTGLIIIVLLLISFGVFRSASLLLHDPLLSVANNYDMIRVQGCIDAYPVRDASVPPWASNYAAPLPQYSFRTDVQPGCFFTSEALFAFAAYPLFRLDAREDGRFSIRWIGAVKLIVLWAFVLIAWRALWRAGSPLMALALVALVGIAMSDPAVMLYAHGFYAEYSAAFFLFVAIVSVVVSLQARSRAWGWIAAIALLGLITSKVQHFALGVGFALLLTAIVLRRGAFRGAIVSVWIGALVGLALQGWHLSSDRTQSMRMANITNTVLYTVLAQADAPHEIAKAIGLPARCGDHAGKDWFTEGMQEHHVCPEVSRVSRIRLLGLSLTHPLLFGRIVLGGIERMRPWVSHLGLVEGESMGKLPASQPTLSSALDLIPSVPFAAAVLGAPFLALAVVLVMRPSDSVRFVLLLLSMLPIVVLVIVVFGDGYSDTAKQAHLGTLSLVSFYGCLLLLGLERWARLVPWGMRQMLAPQLAGVTRVT